MGTATAISATTYGPYRIDWHPERKQPYTVWRAGKTDYFSESHEDVMRWLARRLQVRTW